MPKYDNIVDFSEPFDKYIWFYLIFSEFLLMLIIHILNHNNKSFNISDIIWSLFTMTVKQPIEKNCFSYLNRKILINWCLGCLVLTACYAECIFSLISVPNEYRIETLEELSKALKLGQVQIIGLRHSQSAKFLMVYKLCHLKKLEF